jgi:hypothetical protein
MASTTEERSGQRLQRRGSGGDAEFPAKNLMARLRLELGGGINSKQWCGSALVVRVDSGTDYANSYVEILRRRPRS